MQWKYPAQGRMNKTLNRYGDALCNIGVVLLIICMLSVTVNLLAADDDIYIPYTETYGYTYDPATGQFVKKGDRADSVNTLAAQDMPVTNNSSSMTADAADGKHESAVANATGPGNWSASSDESTIYYILGVAIATLIMIFCWIRWV